MGSFCIDGNRGRGTLGSVPGMRQGRAEALVFAVDLIPVSATILLTNSIKLLSKFL